MLKDGKPFTDSVIPFFYIMFRRFIPFFHIFIYAIRIHLNYWLTNCSEIEAQYEAETVELQECWVELRHVVRCIYHKAGSGLVEDQPEDEQPDNDKMKDLVHRYIVISINFVCIEIS